MFVERMIFNSVDTMRYMNNDVGLLPIVVVGERLKFPVPSVRHCYTAVAYAIHFSGSYSQSMGNYLDMMLSKLPAELGSV
jgi:hypothetical protein